MYYFILFLNPKLKVYMVPDIMRGNLFSRRSDNRRSNDGVGIQVEQKL